jgi:hypothetical protein
MAKTKKHLSLRHNNTNKFMRKLFKSPFANVRTIVVQAAAFMLLFAVISCQSSKAPHESDEPNSYDNIEQFTALQGTKWRLVGIVRGGINLVELEPTHCVECYTLTFETDRIAHVRGVQFTKMLDLCDLPTSPVIVPGFLSCEEYDGNYYCNSNYFRVAILTTMSYSATDEELRLFNYRSGNPAEGVASYLLFKRID